jgi:hypothetical protein
VVEGEGDEAARRQRVGVGAGRLLLDAGERADDHQGRSAAGAGRDAQGADHRGAGDLELEALAGDSLLLMGTG